MQNILRKNPNKKISVDWREGLNKNKELPTSFILVFIPVLISTQLVCSLETSLDTSPIRFLLNLSIFLWFTWKIQAHSWTHRL